MALEKSRDQNPSGLKQTLYCVPHFDKLSQGILEQIEIRAQQRHFEPGQVIYLEGEPGEVLYILESGWIKATRMSAEGREQAMQFLRPCDIFGDIAIWTDSPYPCTVVALEPVTVWVIDKADVRKLVQSFPSFAVAFIQHLSWRVMHYITLVEDLSLRNVEARLAKTLLQHTEISDGQLFVPRRGWTTFDEIAVRLGTVRDVLSRAMQNLEKEGLLSVERKAILILDEDELRARGES